MSNEEKMTPKEAKEMLEHEIKSEEGILEKRMSEKMISVLLR